MVLGGLFTCIAQEIQVRIEFNNDYQVTHFHSQYNYTPTPLPSNSITVQVANLNAEEQRNLVFQIHVPKLVDSHDVDMSSQQAMSQDVQTDGQGVADDSVIGK